MLRDKQGVRVMLGQHIIKLDIDSIRPNPAQPRRSFSQMELQELAESIRVNGLLQPMVVRRVAGGYELVAGERRLRACRMAGLRVVPVIVSNCSEEESAIFALTENLQRQDLNMFEEAEGIRRLMNQWHITQEECAARLGKSQSALANKLRLLKLPGALREQILENHLTERHARALLRLPNLHTQTRALESILRDGLNVQQTDALVEKMLGEKTPRRRTRPVIKDVRIFGNTINHAIQTLKKTGIDAQTFRSETEEYLEWVVRIPKAEAQGRKPA